MKRLKNKILEITALTVITLFMSTSVIAQIQETQQDTTAQDTTIQTDQEQTLPQEQNQRTGDIQEPDEGVDYSESVDKSELPQEVNSSLDELYPAHEVSEVFKGDDDSFKVKVKNEDDEAVVYYNSEGKFLRAENLSGLQQEGALPQNQSQRTQDSQDQWGTDDRTNQQGTQQSTQGTQQENQQDTWGTDADADDIETDDRGTQQQGTWGSENDTMNVEGSTQPQEQNQRTQQRMESQNPDKDVDYSESIDKSELPQEVSSSLDELYPAHEISEVNKGDDDSYKVKVKNEDDEAVVYYDSEGNFLRANNLSGLQQEGALPQEQGQRTNDSQDQEYGTDDRQMHQDTQKDESAIDTDESQYQSGTMQNQQRSGNTDATMQEEHDGSMTYEGSTQSQEQQNNQWGTNEQQGDQQNQWESESDTRQEDTAYPQEQSQRIGDDMRSDAQAAEEMQFNEKVDKSELPEAVTTSIDQKYPNNEISEVYRSEDNKYKVKLNIQDSETVVYYDDKGEFLRVVQDNELDGTSSQEQNQRIQDVEESQDADRWGTEQRMPEQERSQDTWESDTSDTAIGPDNRGGNWGTDDQGAHEGTWDSDEATGTQQGTTEAWGDTTQNEGSAYPQEQNQRTDEQNTTTWGVEGERGTEESDWNSEDTTQTQGEYNPAPVDTVASPQEQFQRGMNDVDYSEELEENELPESVTTSVEDMYPDHEIEKVYRGEDDSYKVELKKDDDKVAVYYDSEGLFSRTEKLNDMMNDMHDDMHDDMQNQDNEDTNQDW